MARKPELPVKLFNPDWILDHGPFVWEERRNPFDRDLIYVVLTRRRETHEWIDNIDEAERYTTALNERMAALQLTAGTPVYKLV